MRKLIHATMYVGLICTISIGFSYAQPFLSDSSLNQAGAKNALTLYYTTIGERLPLYNGPEYYFYDPVIKGNAYFSDINNFTIGKVNYDGTSYGGVPMLYDLVSDKVVVLLYNHFSKYSLLKEKVTDFDLLNHHFVNIDADTIKNNTVIKSGYYDEIYKGKLEVLIKRTKSIQTTTSGPLGLENYFSYTRDFYLWKKNAYYSFGGQGALLDILKDKKRELDEDN